MVNKEEVGYIDAKYAQNEESHEIVDEIAKDNITKKRILIATAVIDNGISIKDKDLRNLVIMADTKESFIQMLGRKRPDGQNVNLYICKRDQRYFERRLRYINQILNFYDIQAAYLNQLYEDYSNNSFVFPFIKNYEANYQQYLPQIPINMSQNMEKEENNNQSIPRPQPVLFAWHMQQNMLMNILSNARIWDYAKKLLYPINGLYAVNSFSLRRFRQLQVFYEDMLEKVSVDEDAFVKEQAGWLGIHEEQVTMSIQDSKEKLDEMHRTKIVEILKSKEYIKKDLSKKDNMKKLRPDLKDEFLYFAKNIENVDEEEAARITKAVTYLGQGDRTISAENFNLFMKIANLSYVMTKKGGSVFWIEEVKK